ncbi:hypothetical protein KP509_10G054400 [Ceratopteris richardii]|uniref:Uncharacterized protein n=1 Tax=Ceratopteris richardii TaxID=49495 RepID=A0A8T2TW13_CERRI|nr:hypothetical protein KP509_10G054400 [Ceratopteris richardii]
MLSPSVSGTHMYHLVASVGADAHKAAINAEDEVLTVLGGKASCRRKFVINVHLLDDDGNTVHEELTIFASVAYAHDRSPIVQDDNLFLAEPPLLTTFNGVEYPSQDRPTRLVGGKASFKLAISLLSSKYDNRLFCICFTPHFSGSPPESGGNATPCLPEPCYSKPIRSISRKRSSSSAAPPLPMTHHVFTQSCPSTVGLSPKVRSPENNANEEVEKLFRLSSATSSSEEEEKANCPNAGDAALDSGSLHYIASNSYKQEAQFLLRSNAVHGDPFYSFHDSYTMSREPFLAGDGAYSEGYVVRRDSPLQLAVANYSCFPSPSPQAVGVVHHESFSRGCLHMDAVQGHRQHYEDFSSPRDIPLFLENGIAHEALITKRQDDEGFTNRSSPLAHAEQSADSHVDSSGKSIKSDLIQKGYFSPNPAASRSESSSPTSVILTSDGSMEQTDTFSQPPSITPVPTTTERPVSVSHPGSQLSSPFRPYNPNAGAARLASNEAEGDRLLRSSPDPNGLSRESPESLLLTPSPISEQMMQPTLAASNSKKSLDAVLHRLLTEASNRTSMSDNGVYTDSDIVDEEQSLLTLEATLKEAIQKLERKKEELRLKRQRLFEDDEGHMQNNVFHPSSWIESLSRKYNY